MTSDPSSRLFCGKFFLFFFAKLSTKVLYNEWQTSFFLPDCISEHVLCYFYLSKGVTFTFILHKYVHLYSSEEREYFGHPWWAVNLLRVLPASSVSTFSLQSFAEPLHLQPCLLGNSLSRPAVPSGWIACFTHSTFLASCCQQQSLSKNRVFITLTASKK